MDCEIILNNVKIPLHAAIAIQQGDIDDALICQAVVQAVYELPCRFQRNVDPTLHSTNASLDTSETATLPTTQDDGEYTFIDSTSARSITPTPRDVVAVNAEHPSLPILVQGAVNRSASASISGQSLATSSSTVFTTSTGPRENSMFSHEKDPVFEEAPLAPEASTSTVERAMSAEQETPAKPVDDAVSDPTKTEPGSSPVTVPQVRSLAPCADPESLITISVTFYICENSTGIPITVHMSNDQLLSFLLESTCKHQRVSHYGYKILLGESVPLHGIMMPNIFVAGVEYASLSLTIGQIFITSGRCSLQIIPDSYVVENDAYGIVAQAS